MSKLKELFSYFWGIKVKKIKSPLNGTLEVWYISGRYQLDAKNVNYSYGSLHRLFQKVFKEAGLAELKPADMLLLGLGAGSVVSILRDELRLATRITAIDHDPEVIDLARKYFNIDRYSGLDIICRDALDHVAEADTKYDVIVIDLFHDQLVPDKFRSELFLNHCLRLLSANGMLIFNFIVKEKKQQKQFDQLTSLFRSYGGKLNILEVFSTNKVVIFSRNRESAGTL